MLIFSFTLKICTISTCFQHRPVQLTQVRRALAEHKYMWNNQESSEAMCDCKTQFNQVKSSRRKYRPLDTTHPVALLLTQPLELLRRLLEFPQTPLVLLLQLPHLKHKATS